MADLTGALTSFGSALDLFGGAAGSAISAGGYAKEAAAYGTAAAIAAGNADLMETNKTLSGESTALQVEGIDKQTGRVTEQMRIQDAANKVKLAQTNRQIYQVTGAARAAISANGVTEGGSAMDILRSNAMQGRLETAMIHAEGAITQKQGEGVLSDLDTQRKTTQKQGEIDLQNIELQKRSFQEQAAAYFGQQGSAEAAGDAAKAGAASKGAGGIIGTIAGIAKLFF